MSTAFGRDLVIDRKALKPYMKRTDRHGVVHFVSHMGLLAATGYLVHLSLGGGWIVPAILLHGFVMAFLFAPAHECSHGTPFRTRWLNEAVFWFVSLVYIVPPTFFRYAHAAHHTHTQIRGSDPDMVMPRRAALRDYLVYVSAVPFWRRNLLWFLRHALGTVHPSQRYFLPDTEIPRVVWEARLILLIYAGIGGTAIYLGSWAPVIYWLLPRLAGEPFMRWIRIAEHAECAETGDLRENTRTTRAPAWMHFLFWNMSYHAEHHLCPTVPFHALPRLHEQVRERLHPEGEGYFQVHAEVLKNLVNRRGKTWTDSEGAAA